MDKVCQYCHALKFRNEAAGMCCASGKVVLSPLPAPPEPLLSLLTGNSDDSKLFLQDHNQLIQLIKRVSPRLQNDNYQIVIKADKVPLGEYAGRFNAPTVDEVAVIMVGDPVDKRSIKITRRDNTISTISDLNRSYDALQYPLIFWQGQDEYHLNIKQYDPNTGDYRNNKVSSMNYYAHRIMVRQHQDNYILRYRQLFHQYIVDMYAKVESERLRFLRFNQAKLRSEEYIHLRDAVAGNIDGNLNPNDIGNAFILPSSYIGSPRNMQEYMQDAMTYVRHYGRPDLFITFTCNPNWEEIQTLLLPGQQAIHRHDLTARVFKQKLKSLIDFIVKYSIFGITRCWLYTIEWQKRGLPHAHILVWLKDRIRPEEIDQIISAEIPDPLIDQGLFDIVTKHMIHGPCGAFNMTSPCMENGKCKKTSQSRIRMTRSRILMVIQSIAAEVLRMVATHLQCDCRTFQIKLSLIMSGWYHTHHYFQKLTKLISMLSFAVLLNQLSIFVIM
ncbi:helitron_like_N domain-containing protein [Trichonephila clavipes]|nr:helitron_like_N domain-containing protein [Trichonephila clavipes]